MGAIPVQFNLGKALCSSNSSVNFTGTRYCYDMLI